MPTAQTIRDLLSVESTVSVWFLALDILAAGLLSGLLGVVYARYGRAISNRRVFARSLPVLAMTTALVIAIVKSSLALSLGLVGALSIVRFRTAIKEPEELSFLFISIAIGLGCGAHQVGPTGLSLGIIFVFIWLLRQRSTVRTGEVVQLHITDSGPDPVGIEALSKVLTETCEFLELRRYDQEPERTQAFFLARLPTLEALSRTVEQIRAVAPRAHVSFLHAPDTP